MARLTPTARAMSSMLASRTPLSSKSCRVAATISASRARRRAAAAVRRPSVAGGPGMGLIVGGGARDILGQPAGAGRGGLSDLPGGMTPASGDRDLVSLDGDVH